MFRTEKAYQRIDVLDSERAAIGSPVTPYEKQRVEEIEKEMYQLQDWIKMCNEELMAGEWEDEPEFYEVE